MEKNGSSDFTQVIELQNASERLVVEFLQTDLSLSFTFADLAETERKIGDPAASRSILEKAEVGYATIARFLPRVKQEEAKDEISRSLIALRARLDGAQAAAPS